MHITCQSNIRVSGSHYLVYQPDSNTINYLLFSIIDVLQPSGVTLPQKTTLLERQVCQGRWLCHKCSQAGDILPQDTQSQSGLTSRGYPSTGHPCTEPTMWVARPSAVGLGIFCQMTLHLIHDWQAEDIPTRGTHAPDPHPRAQPSAGTMPQAGPSGGMAHGNAARRLALWRQWGAHVHAKWHCSHFWWLNLDKGSCHTFPGLIRNVVSCICLQNVG